MTQVSLSLYGLLGDPVFICTILIFIIIIIIIDVEVLCFSLPVRFVFHSPRCYHMNFQSLIRSACIASCGTRDFFIMGCRFGCSACWPSRTDIYGDHNIRQFFLSDFEYDLI